MRARGLPGWDSAQAIADTIAKVLSDRGIDELARWGVLEYWAQIEVWRHLSAIGGANFIALPGEPPYRTRFPVKKNRNHPGWGVKGADLGLCRREPPAVLLHELKNAAILPEDLIERAKSAFPGKRIRTWNQAVSDPRGLKADLAALVGLDVEGTAAALEQEEAVLEAGYSRASVVEYRPLARFFREGSVEVASIFLLTGEPLPEQAEVDAAVARSIRPEIREHFGRGERGWAREGMCSAWVWQGEALPVPT